MKKATIREVKTAFEMERKGLAEYWSFEEEGKTNDSIKDMANLLANIIYHNAIKEPKNRWKRITLQFWMTKKDNDHCYLNNLCLWSHTKKLAEEINLVDITDKKKRRKKK